MEFNKRKAAIPQNRIPAIQLSAGAMNLILIFKRPQRWRRGGSGAAGGRLAVGDE